MATSVLIVDDHRVFGQGLEAVLGAQSGFSARCLSEPGAVVDAVTRDRPDVVIMDLRLGEVSGLDLIRALTDLPAPPAVVVLTAYADAASVVRAIRAGAVGFVAKDASIEQLICAVRSALLDGSWLPADLLAKLLSASPVPDAEPYDDIAGRLTARELDVLRLMVSGLDKKAIAARLSQSPNTVRTHVRNLTAKLGCHSALEVVAVALKAGLRPE
ncbi:MAG: response regulator transcription factor [Actinomycetota bacterium]|nr:response regulator transcription factor [Actinomycetota bacterium]